MEKRGLFRGSVTGYMPSRAEEEGTMENTNEKTVAGNVLFIKEVL